MPRVRHPDWLHKKLLEKNDVYKQKKINELFVSKGKKQVKRGRERCWQCQWGFSLAAPILLLSLLSQILANPPVEGTPSSQVGDIEDFGAVKIPLPLVPIANKRKRIPTAEESQELSQNLELSQSWREILGPPPSLGTTKVGEADCAGDAPGLYSSIQAWVLPGGSCGFHSCTLRTHTLNTHGSGILREIQPGDRKAITDREKGVVASLLGQNMM